MKKVDNGILDLSSSSKGNLDMRKSVNKLQSVLMDNNTSNNNRFKKVLEGNTIESILSKSQRNFKSFMNVNTHESLKRLSLVRSMAPVSESRRNRSAMLFNPVYHKIATTRAVNDLSSGKLDKELLVYKNKIGYNNERILKA